MCSGWCWNLNRNVSRRRRLLATKSPEETAFVEQWGRIIRICLHVTQTAMTVNWSTLLQIFQVWFESATNSQLQSKCFFLLWNFLYFFFFANFYVFFFILENWNSAATFWRVFNHFQRNDQKDSILMSFYYDKSMQIIKKINKFKKKT